MNNFFILSILIINFLLLSGCSTPLQPYWSQSNNELIQEHNYIKALAQVKAQKPFNKANEYKIKQHLRGFRVKEVRGIKRLLKQKKWGLALNKLTFLKNNLPVHKNISSLTKKLTSGKKEEERIINTKLALLQAELLKAEFKQQAFLKRSHQHEINWFNRTALLTQKKQQLAEQLMHLSTLALNQKDYQRAMESYMQAVAFNQQLNTSALSHAINQGLNKQSKKSILKRQLSLISQLNKALKLKNFKSILKLQNILSKAPFKGKSVQTALKSAIKLRTKETLALSQKAEAAYHQGNIGHSIKLWKQAHKLTPGQTDIEKKLSRAKKVQYKLEKLRHGK